jgi:hypothetical protein
VANQDSKQQNWLLDTARAAELTLDEELENEMGDEETRSLKAQQQKKVLDKARAELQDLLAQPVPGIAVASQPKSSCGKDLGLSNRRGNYSSSNDGLKRRGGMIVFAK